MTAPDRIPSFIRLAPRHVLLALGLIGVNAAPAPAANLPPAADAPVAKKAPTKPAAARPAAPKTAAPAAPAVAAAPTPPKAPPPQPRRPVERELHIVAIVEATQEWHKNDPKYPGEQWSKGTTTQRYEITTRLHSEGKLELRNLLDPDLNARLEAKTIFLAREAKKMLDKPGHPIKLPTNDQEKAAFMEQMQLDLNACVGDLACGYEKQLYYAALSAAMDNPQAMEDDEEPGRYLYFLPYKGCPSHDRITIEMNIQGVRYNKDVDEFIPFTERHTADSVNAADELALCTHYTAVIDTQDAAKPMWQETIFVPRPVGITEYTENKHTAREQQPQPIVTAAVDWMGTVLRHAPASGKASATLPLPLPLNQNATWLGLWTGTAKVSMEWSFKEVPASTAPAKP